MPHYALKDLSSLDDEISLTEFNFTYNELRMVALALGLPAQIKFRDGEEGKEFEIDRVMALAIMLRRLVYPARYLDLEFLFGLSGNILETVFNGMSKLLYHHFHEGIRLNKRHLHSFNLRKFSHAISKKGGCYNDVVGFINEGLNPYITEWDSNYDIRYQTIVTPDGITISLTGPFVGYTTISKDLLDHSKVFKELHTYLDYRALDRPLYTIYGNPVYHGSSEVIRRPIRIAKEADEKMANQIMKPLQTDTIIQSFEQVAELFEYFLFPFDKEVSMSELAQHYVVATLMKNIHTCVYGTSKTSRFFSLEPPTLINYIKSISPNCGL